MGWITVVEPGMQSTVQDLGREGQASLGVPPGGAFDALSLRAGNRLVGNPDNAPGFECTLIGPTLKFEHDAVIAVTGAESTNRQFTPWAGIAVRAGDTLRVGPLDGGVRAYLCVAGGLRVPPVLGRASTLLGAGFGGHHGRALKAGDRLEFNDAHSTRPLSPSAAGLLARVHRDASRPETPLTLRAVDGPHLHAFASAAVRDFWTSSFRVSNQSNRAGVRLEGSVVFAPASSHMTSEGAFVGAVQVTPSGQPIALGVDGPTTGGYPVIAAIATVDLHLLGQARPGRSIRFDRISIQQARDALIGREREWEETFK